MAAFNKPHRLLYILWLIMASATNLMAGLSTGNETDNTRPSVSATPFKTELIEGIVGQNQQIRAGLLYDVELNKIVWEKDMEYAYPIASLTKMMVALLAVEDINAGKISWEDKITVSRTYKKYYRGRRRGTYTVQENYSFEDLVKMAMIPSHNESTVWIAKHCSGDLTAFVTRMNQRALELGMTKTLYSNPSGLPAIIDELDNSSSPKDQLILAMELLKHPKLLEITSIPYLNVHNGKGQLNFRNHNGLVINYGLEVDGLKTGYTRAAGFCMAATAKRGNHRLIGIVFGCSSPYVRNGIVANMMNRYYEAIKMGRLGETLPDLAESKAFIDSVAQGLATIRVSQDYQFSGNNATDESFTYKTITQRVKKTIVVRNGDNLGKLADRYNTSVSNIRKWNGLRSTVIRPGQKLHVYQNVKKTIPVKLIIDPNETADDLATSGDVRQDDENNSQDTSENKDAASLADNIKSGNGTTETVSAPSNDNNKPYRFIYHTVKTGDTLWNIAQRYRLTTDQLIKLNKISNGNQLRKGEKLKIPMKG